MGFAGVAISKGLCGAGELLLQVIYMTLLKLALSKVGQPRPGVSVHHINLRLSKCPQYMTSRRGRELHRDLFMV